jgi:RNA polymerase sigma-70 factor (ECF subfamily)
MLLGQTDAADDVVQEVFVRVMQNLEGFREEASPVTWLYHITTNLCVDQLRKRARRQELELTPELQSCIAAGASPVDQRLASREEIQRLLERSDEQTLQIFVHTFIDEMSQEETAATMGLSRKTVWTRLDRLRRRFAAGREGGAR